MPRPATHRREEPTLERGPAFRVVRVIAFDTETSLIRPALLAPPLVCVAWQRPGMNAGIAHHSDVEDSLAEWLKEYTLVGHNVAYDLAVIAERFPDLRPPIFKAYAEDRVTDTMIRQQLLDIAGGVFRGRLGEKGRWITHEYTLEALAKRNTEIRLLKDGWRLSYSEFLNTPLADWPRRAREVQAAARPRLFELETMIFPDDATAKAVSKEVAGLVEMIEGDPDRASEYPLDDARATLAVYLAQEKHAAYLQDQYRQARAAFALHLSSAWGLRTDAVGVELLRSTTQANYDALEEELISLGLIRNDKAKTRDTKAAKARMVRVCREEKITLRRTDAHADPNCTKCRDEAGNPLPAGDDACVEHVALDSDACNATGDEVLEAYTEASVCKKVLSNDVAALVKGVEYPVHTRYGIAETGRTTSSKPNIQNLRRMAGVREAFVPRTGKVFAAADYPQLELYTLAQCCVSWLGQSKLAEALNRGLDPHLAMAAQIVGVSYEDAKAHIDTPEIDNARQTAKVANFGFPGGLGIAKLCLFAKKTYNVDLTLDAAKLLKEQWFATWPEMPHYFARVNALCDTPDGRASVESLFTKRIRGGASYCAACNNGFQALGADCAKEALWRVAKAQYDDPASPLFNTRTVAFVHDEIIVEADEATAHEAAQALSLEMREAANLYLKDVPIVEAKMKPLLMRRWSKKAKPVLGADGRLIPWEM
jgi:DNA polymerase-1